MLVPDQRPIGLLTLTHLLPDDDKTNAYADQGEQLVLAGHFGEAIPILKAAERLEREPSRRARLRRRIGDAFAADRRARPAYEWYTRTEPLTEVDSFEWFRLQLLESQVLVFLHRLQLSHEKIVTTEAYIRTAGASNDLSTSQATLLNTLLANVKILHAVFRGDYAGADDLVRAAIAAIHKRQYSEPTDRRRAAALHANLCFAAIFAIDGPDDRRDLYDEWVANLAPRMFELLDDHGGPCDDDLIAEFRMGDCVLRAVAARRFDLPDVLRKVVEDVMAIRRSTDSPLPWYVIVQKGQLLLEIGRHLELTWIEEAGQELVDQIAHGQPELYREWKSWDVLANFHLDDDRRLQPLAERSAPSPVSVQEAPAPGSSIRRMLRRVASAASAMLLCVAIGTVSTNTAQAASASLTGRVHDGGIGLPGSQIVVVLQDGQVASATSGSDGTFALSFANVTGPTQGSIHASHSGCGSTFTGAVIIDPLTATHASIEIDCL